MCKHENFNCFANVGRLTDLVGRPPDELAFTVDVRITCIDCGMPFEWVGLPNGSSHYQPTVSIDGQELRAPLVPKGGVVPPGLPGFSVTHTVADPTKQTPEVSH